MRGFLALVFMLLTAAAASAQSPPDTRPILRIEPGMHMAAIRGIDTDAEGKLLVTASDDKTARLWSLPGGELLRTFRVPIDTGDGGKLYAVAISPDGRTVAAAGYDLHATKNGQGLFVYLFDTASGNIRQRLGPIPDVVNALDFSPDGSRLAAGMSSSKGLAYWKAPFGETMLGDTDYGAPILGLQFDAENHLFVAAQDGMARHYDADLNGVARAASEGSAPLDEVAVSPDGELVAIGYLGTPRIDILAREGLAPLYTADTKGLESGDVSVAAWSADGRTLYGTGAYFDKSDTFPIFAWNKKGRGARKSIGGEGANALDAIALPQGGLAVATADPAIRLADPDGLRTGRVVADLRSIGPADFRVSKTGGAARFSLDPLGKDNWIFDGRDLTFEPSPAAPDGFIAPETGLLPIWDWEDSANPSIAGTPIAIDPNDRSRSLAIAHSAKSFVLGTNFSLNKYDKDGGILWRRPVPGTVWSVNLSDDDALVLAGFGDGTVRWYRANDGEELLAVFVHDPTRRWIAWTPSGYYAASPGAEDLIGWQVNGKTWDETPKFYPASRFRDQFYRPDIVALAVGLRSEAEAVKEANAKAGRKENGEAVEALLPASVELLAPGLQLEAGAPEIAVPYALSSPTGRAVTRVEARIDGRPVSTRGAVEVSDDYPLGAPLEISVSIPPRDAELSLIAFIGDQPGVAATIPVKWTGVRTGAKKPKLFALLVGVSDYANADLKLKYAAKDAADLAEALRAQDGVFYGSVEIETLLDGGASKAAVETALAKLRKKVGPEDTAVVFFAGHGMTDAALDFYFLTADAEMDADLLAATAVGGDVIRKGLARVPGRVVLFMDTCRSGAGIEGRVDMSRAANDFGQEAGGLVMFASSQGREVSFERSDWANGAFTEALLAIIADGKFYGEDGKLSIPELEEAVTTKVSELTEGRQNAGMTKYGAVPRFFIAGLK